MSLPTHGALPIGTVVEVIDGLLTSREFDRGERGVVVSGPNAGYLYVMPLSEGTMIYNSERRMLVCRDPQGWVGRFRVVSVPPVGGTPSVVDPTKMTVKEFYEAYKDRPLMVRESGTVECTETWGSFVVEAGWMFTMELKDRGIDMPYLGLTLVGERHYRVGISAIPSLVRLFGLIEGYVPPENWSLLPPELAALMTANPESPLCRGFFRARYNLAPSASDTPTTAEGWKTWINSRPPLVVSVPAAATGRVTYDLAAQPVARRAGVRYTYREVTRARLHFTREDVVTRAMELPDDLMIQLARTASTNGSTLQEEVDTYICANPTEGRVIERLDGDREYAEPVVDSVSDPEEIDTRSDDLWERVTLFLREHPEYAQAVATREEDEALEDWEEDEDET